MSYMMEIGLACAGSVRLIKNKLLNWHAVSMCWKCHNDEKRFTAGTTHARFDFHTHLCL